MVTMVVEDGTGLATANSYISIADADTYFTQQGTAGAAWAAPDALKTEYLVRAAAALDDLYGRKYISYLPASDDTIQGLLWPRENVWDRHNRRIPAGNIPQEVKDAQCEMALLAQNGISLYPEGRAGNNILSESVAVGELSQSVTYQRQPEEQAMYENYRKIELILWPVIRAKNTKMKFAI